MMGLGSPVRDLRAAGLIVGILAVLVYANSLANGFAFDDVQIIDENTAIQSPSTLPGALTVPYWPGPYGRELGLWRPATTLSYGVLHIVGGGSPVAFHVANVLGHAAVSVMVLLLCAALMPLAAALVAGLVFAVHPVHVEAVSNGVGYAEILSTAAMLLACLVHVRGPTVTSWSRALAIGALYVVAFGAKESGVTLPGLILVIDAVRQRCDLGDLRTYVSDRWRAYAVMMVVAVALLAARLAVLGSVANPFPPFGADLLAQVPRIWTLGEAWNHYASLWAFPLDLSADYSPNVIPISLGWGVDNTTGVVMALAVLAMAWVAARQPALDRSVHTARAVAFGVIWFVVAISPTSNFFFLSGVILAERTLYLPTVGLAAATGWLVLELAKQRPRVAWTALAVALALLATRTWTRTPVWRDNQTFFASLIRDTPHAGRAQWILGDSFLRSGNTAQAMIAYRNAINILDGHYTLIMEISQRLMEIERWSTAEYLLMQSYRELPQFALAPSLLAWTRAQYGDPVGTERFARASLEIYPEDVTREHLLAWALAAQGRWEEAAESRTRAEGLTATVNFWHRSMYSAYVARHEGDTLRMRVALDSAWVGVATGLGRRTMDSIRVAEFGAPPGAAIP
jgi:tetratricopeptide (TPR) repeat protein